MEQALQSLKSQCLAPGFEEMDFLRLSEPPEDPQSVFEAARVSPFGSPRRLIVVNGLEKLDEEWLAALWAYLAHPNPKACVLIYSTEEGKSFRPPAVLERQLQVVWCREIKGRELNDWVVRRATESGTAIDPAAAALLMGRVGSDLQSLGAALEALALLAGPGSRILPAHVEALIAPSMKETAFDILDAAAAGRPDRAIGLLRLALQQGQISMEQFMGALGWYYRMVWKSKHGRGGTGWMSPGRQAALRRLTRWPDGKLQGAFEEVLRADVGLRLGAPVPELTADQLLLELGG